MVSSIVVHSLTIILIILIIYQPTSSIMTILLIMIDIHVPIVLIRLDIATIITFIVI